MIDNKIVDEWWNIDFNITSITHAADIAQKRCNAIPKFIPQDANAVVPDGTMMQIDWCSEFCGGIAGFKARIFGVQVELPELLGVRGAHVDAFGLDYHLAALFFAMDSALECLAYAMNAIGWACAPPDCRCYKELHVLKALRSIDLGVFTNATKCGYCDCPSFATVRKCWQSPASQSCISRLTEQHDVTKHRRATMAGYGQREIASNGISGSDPPPFLDSIIRLRNNPPGDFILHENIKALPVEKAAAAAHGKPYGKPLEDLRQKGEVYFLSELMKQYKLLIEETAKAFASDINALLVKY